MTSQDFFFIIVGIGIFSACIALIYFLYHLTQTIKVSKFIAEDVKNITEDVEDITNEVVTTKNSFKSGVVKMLSVFVRGNQGGGEQE